MTDTLATDAQLQYRDYAAKAMTHAVLPFGQPGRMVKKSVYGEKYLYREVSVLSGDVRLRKLGAVGDPDVQMADAVFRASSWMSSATMHLRNLGFYGAARQLEEPLINAFNLGLFDTGAVLIGPLAYLFWSNEFGLAAIAHAPAAPDLDVALPLEAALDEDQLRFINRCIKTRQSRLHVHFDSSDYTAYLNSRIKLPFEALRKRHCFISNLNYLMQDARSAVAMVGDYLVPVKLPAPARLYWQKRYWSRLPDNPRAALDLAEAATLFAWLQQHTPGELTEAAAALPAQWARQLVVADSLGLHGSDDSSSQISAPA